MQAMGYWIAFQMTRYPVIQMILSMEFLLVGYLVCLKDPHKMAQLEVLHRVLSSELCLVATWYAQWNRIKCDRQVIL